MKAISVVVFLVIFFFKPKNYWVTATADNLSITDTIRISKVPSSLGLNSFYKKYIDADGIPVVGSGSVPDLALLQARKIVIQMLSDLKISGVIAQLKKKKIRIAVMSKDEVTTDIPEHSDLNTAFPGTNWNSRGRGFGATLARPATSCAEENLLCYLMDPYRGENILVHEFAHTIHELGISYLEPDFNKKLEKIYKSAKEKGLWRDTYAISNFKEYWAEGVQDFFNANLQAVPANGIHNEINTREELKNYDRDLFIFICAYFKKDNNKIGCHSTMK
jgi:hypothetical protein